MAPPGRGRISQRQLDPQSIVEAAKVGGINCSPRDAHTPLVSVIVPVFNAEAYVVEAVESVLHQSLPAFETFEIILVDDGSTDASGSLCDELARRYPHTVVVHHQVNGGVSAARNQGLKLSRGEFVCFLDADDALHRDALCHALQVYLDSPVQLDFVVMSTMFFGARSGQHHHNARLQNGLIVDIAQDWRRPQMSVHSTLIKGDAARSIMFLEGLAYAEDSLYMTNLLLAHSGRFAIARAAHYKYRKRAEADSAIDVSKLDPRWYQEPFELLHPALNELAAGHPEHALYCNMVSGYELQWRYRASSWNEALQCLGEREATEYLAKLNAAIVALDDRSIMAQRYLSREAKGFWYHLKYGDSWPQAVDFDPTSATTSMPPREERAAINSMVSIDLVEQQGAEIIVEGSFAAPFWPGAQLTVRIDAHDVPYSLVSRPLLHTKMLNQTVAKPQGFRVAVAREGELQFLVQLPNSPEAPRISQPRYRKSSMWSNEMSHNFRSFARFLVTQTVSGLRIQRRTLARRALAEFRFDRALWALPRGRESVLWRLTGLAAHLVRGRRDLWLLSDRTTAAGDNAEAILKRVIVAPPPRTLIRFALRKDSPDWERMSNFAPTVHHGGVYYKVLFLAATHIISSHADDYVTNPFGRRWWRYANLYRGHFVFLQHGVNNNDLAGWLNRYNKNISLMVTSMPSECEDMRGERYGYEPKHIALTGLPRFDALVSNPQRTIAIMPTWRQNLAGPLNVNTGLRAYNPQFIASEYFSFYQKLLVDADIAAACQQHNYTFEFYLHPALAAQAKDFEGSKYAKIMVAPHDYAAAIERSSGLVTDYSSVAFDMAYLMKPTIYAHFDAETIYSHHIYGGDVPRFFTHSTDGFGPVTYSYAETKESIVSMIATNARLVEPYATRVEHAFPVRDQQQSERVIAAIRELKPKRGAR